MVCLSLLCVTEHWVPLVARIHTALFHCRTPVFSVSLLHPTTQVPQFAGQKLKSPFVVRITVNASMELPDNTMLEVSSERRRTMQAISTTSNTTWEDKYVILGELCVWEPAMYMGK